MEGDTNDGKYNPKLDPDGNRVHARAPTVRGYPPQETSPYKLPYEQGVSMFVGQANQGFFSHMRFNSLPQIYGYDFAHDYGDEILASRGGTVVDYFDWLPDTVDRHGSGGGGCHHRGGSRADRQSERQCRQRRQPRLQLELHHDPARHAGARDHDRDVGGPRLRLTRFTATASRAACARSSPHAA